ncbi:MAG: alpha/beta hydrolase [Solobacterium sp.]|nr:alpha/beta hydrolase [Solobacterium sp.]
MKIHAFGKENEKTIVLIHPALVMWDYFEYVIPLLQEKYHLIIPALPGYDEQTPGDFTSVEEIAGELADWLLTHGITEISCIYGCSMGGSVIARFLAERRIHVQSAVMDGGITPYQLPWILTRLIAVRDFLMVCLGKCGGVRLLKKTFTSDKYSDEDLQYLAKVLKFISVKTIWRTFESCNNYSMPKKVRTDCRHIEYWYAKSEAKDRKWDIAYIRKQFPNTVFRVFEETGHGGLALLKPQLLASEIERILED